MEVKLLKVIFGDNVSSKEKDQKFYWDFISDSGTLILPDGITEIPDCAFKNCKDLRQIIIPEGVTSIGTDAFVGCTNLTEIVLPESISSIGIDFLEIARIFKKSISRKICNISAEPS